MHLLRFMLNNKWIPFFSKSLCQITHNLGQKKKKKATVYAFIKVDIDCKSTNQNNDLHRIKIKIVDMIVEMKLKNPFSL